MLNTLYKNHSKCLAWTVLRSFQSFRHASIKVAVVGSGPAGFYTTQKLLKNSNVEVDIYEKLPVPFGLVRYGVAPDHAEVKNVINSFTNIANSDRVNFYGNVALGDNIALDDLIEAYHAVVLCYGSARDKTLDIEGEGAKNMISARNFVGWYNGVPENKDLEINLDCDTACIVGQGNVALDCARILMKPADLDKTDITSYAQKLIAASKIKRIFIIGRRGPIQTSFTTKELRELTKLDGCYARLEPSSIFRDNKVTLEKLSTLSRQRRRLTELLLNLSTVHERHSKSIDGIECIFKFLSKPHKILTDQKTNRVSGIELQTMRYNSVDEFMDENARPVEEDTFIKIDSGLILRSIGYKAVMVDKNLPMNQKANSISNADGRVHGYKSLYCSGWLATGATGVIAGTLNSSQITAHSILDDIQSRRLPGLSVTRPGHEHIKKILSAKGLQVVHFNDWLEIDKLERQIGEKLGKTREKVVEIDTMLDVVNKD